MRSIYVKRIEALESKINKADNSKVNFVPIETDQTEEAALKEAGYQRKPARCVFLYPFDFDL